MSDTIPATTLSIYPDLGHAHTTLDCTLWSLAHFPYASIKKEKINLYGFQTINILSYKQQVFMKIKYGNKILSDKFSKNCINHINTYITELCDDAEKLCFNEAVIKPNNAGMIEVS